MSDRLSKDGYDRVEHDGNANAKNVSIVKSMATIYAVVNTGAAGTGNTTVSQGSPWSTSILGNITIESGSIAVTSAPTLYAVVNTDDSLSGNVTVEQGSAWETSLIGNVTIEYLPAWNDPKTYIGLATVDIGSSTTLDIASNSGVTVYQGVTPWTTSVKGNITIDQVDTVVAVTNITNPVALKGNITIDSGTISLSATDNTVLDNIDTNTGNAVTELQALNSLAPATYDYIALGYTGANLTTVTFKTGGSGGTTISGLDLAYTGSVLDSVTKT